MLLYVYSIVEVVSFVISFQLQNCVSCYSERGIAEAGSSEQYLQYLRGFTSRWRQLDYNFMYRKFTRAVVVSWSWYTDGRGPSLCCQPLLSDIWLAITYIVLGLWTWLHWSRFDDNINLIIFVTGGEGVAGVHHRGQEYRANLPSLLFLPRCIECRRGLAMRILSVHLSVCPSHAWIVTKR